VCGALDHCQPRARQFQGENLAGAKRRERVLRAPDDEGVGADFGQLQAKILTHHGETGNLRGVGLQQGLAELRARQDDLRVEMQPLERREDLAREVGKPVERLGDGRHEFQAEVREILAGGGVSMQDTGGIDDDEPSHLLRIRRRVAQRHDRAHRMSDQHERAAQETTGYVLEDARVVCRRIEGIRFVGLPESRQIYGNDVKRLLQPCDVVAEIARRLIADPVHQ